MTTATDLSSSSSSLSTSTDSVLPHIPPPSRSSSLVVDSVSSGYYGSRVIDGISFTINKPGIYVVLGSNGAGKTTLFRTLAGILRPYSGRVEINGCPASRREQEKSSTISPTLTEYQMA